MLPHKKQEFDDTRVFHLRSLKSFSFGAVLILKICYVTWQLVDEGISETTNMKKVMKTSYGKIINQHISKLTYQVYYLTTIIS